MINLLPYDAKNQVLAAHTNVKLLSYLLVILVSAVFLALASGVSYIFVTNSQSSSSDDNSTSYASLQSQYNTMTSEVLTAQTLLGQSYNYSDAIMDITTAMPSGLVASNISIDNSKNQITIELQAKSTSLINEFQNKIASYSQFTNFIQFDIPSNARDTYPIKTTVTIDMVRGV